MNMTFTKQTGRLILLAAALFLDVVSFGQKIHTDTINGEVFHVYPFRSNVSYHSSYYSAWKRDVFVSNRKINKMWYKDMEGEFNRKDFRRFMKDVRQENRMWKEYEESGSNKRKLKRAVRVNPMPMLEQHYSMEKDIVPFLDPIPDGRYVQYFDSFNLIKKNGKGTLIGDRISGIFTIKNNVLDGPACWLNMDGDTLKYGMFKEGLKEGEWILINRKLEFSLSKENIKHYADFGYPKMDTIVESFHFVNGIKNGKYSMYSNSYFPVIEGAFSDNEMIGEWIEREIQITGKGSKRKRNRYNENVTFRYTPVLSDTIVKRPMIRFHLIKSDDFSNEFEFESKYEPNIRFSKLYSLAIPKDESFELELEEELVNSYEGGDEEDMGMYEEEMYYEDEEYYYEEMYSRESYDYKLGKYISHAKLIDSLGIKFNFDGVYEKRYPNGQLMVRYEFDNGTLLQEDTIFWDNGRPYDVIVFEEDSSHYIQRIYDYTGILYKEIVFDSIGDFIRLNFEPAKVKYLTIDGFVAEDRIGNGKYFFFDKLDTLAHEIADSMVIFRSWFKKDTSLLYSRSYNPMDKTLQFYLQSIQGNKVLDAEINFAEDFESWTGQKNYTAGPLRLETKTSASFNEFYPKDSIPQTHVNSFGQLFDLTEDYTLLVKENPFSGPIELGFRRSALSINVGKKLTIDFPKPYEKLKKLQNDVDNYRMTGKCKNKLLFSIIDASEIDEEYAAGIFGGLFGGPIGDWVEYPYDGYYGEYESKSKRKMAPYPDRVTGYFLNGKPDGIWKVYDQFGKLLTEMNYKNGELEGELRQYAYAYPRDREYYYEDYGDTFPKKKTYYNFNILNFKNGMQNGEASEFDWTGQLLSRENFVDGLRQGPAFERNTLAHTNLNYLDNSLDGYVRTYLTIPERDSILLFDLNFQNGLLQGESKSYHINGGLAKRGFFLNGDPIDDYEAYDTLGFKYHYVKFMYSFPVEEKIWEENQLSVRYLFDWRDSIRFVPQDITSTQSLDRILYQYGIGEQNLYRPYFGRPSLIDKKGIDYHMTKYYPNDTIARDGLLSKGKKVGCWKYYSYEGEMLYEADYFDTILVINDSVSFKSKGILTDYDANGNKLYDAYIIEKFEKYDCSHTDHYEIRQLFTIWESNDSLGRMNGYVKNYYDNGVLQNEGLMKDGLPTGVWKYYDPYGKLNQVGEFVQGKRNGRWLAGDLSKTKYLGDICLNPNMPNLEEEIKYREKLLDIMITNYKMGKALNKEFYDVNMNNFEEGGEDVEMMEEEEKGE